VRSLRCETQWRLWCACPSYASLTLFDSSSVYLWPQGCGKHIDTVRVRPPPPPSPTQRPFSCIAALCGNLPVDYGQACIQLVVTWFVHVPAAHE